MAGRDRKPVRRVQKRTKATIAEAVRPLRVSVITIPAAGQYGPVLHQDVQLVRVIVNTCG